jgi:hypothetical protein
VLCQHRIRAVATRGLLQRYHSGRRSTHSPPCPSRSCLEKMLCVPRSTPASFWSTWTESMPTCHVRSQMKKNCSGVIWGPAMMAQMSASCQCLQGRVFTDAENIIRTARKMSSVNYKATYHAPLLLRATSWEMLTSSLSGQRFCALFKNSSPGRCHI